MLCSGRGCMDSEAFNYNDLDKDNFSDYLTDLLGVDINTDDGSCYPFVYGCMDPEAFNYNDLNGDKISDPITNILGVDVNSDDGSCYTASDYQYSMSVTGIIEIGENNFSVNSNDLITAFDSEGNNVGRSVSSSLYMPHLDANLYFLMVYSNRLVDSMSVVISFEDAGNISYSDIHFFIKFFSRNN